jgi:hypothetical protein
MFTAALFFIRMAFSQVFKVLGQIAAFTIAHWRIILPLAIVGVMCWMIYSARSARDAAIAELQAYQQAVKTAVAIRQAENQTKQTTVKLLQDAVVANHLNQINKLKENYEARQHTTDSSIDNWRERVRLELAKNTAAGLPDIPQATGQPAASGQDRDAAAARQTLELACAITTADYNALHEAWDKGCTVMGCR